MNKMNKWIRKCFLLVLLCTYSFLGFSQIKSENSKIFFDYLYAFEFEKADSLLSTIDSIKAGLQHNFLKAHFIRWYYLPIHQQSEDVLNMYNRYLVNFEDEQEIDGIQYIQTNSALLRAEYHYNKGNYYKAFQNGSVVYDLVKKHLDEEPKQIELKFLASLYHYYFEFYKKQNPAFSPMMWFFKEGNKETGLKWLQEVVNTPNIVQTEALIYLSHIYLRLENQPEKAFVYAEKLHQKFPENLKFYEMLLESAIANEQNEERYYELVDKLINSHNIYYEKFGYTYKALLKANFSNSSPEEKLRSIDQALEFVKEQGGGPHLRSLLLKEKIRLDNNNVNLVKWVSELKESRVYEYKLTLI